MKRKNEKVPEFDEIIFENRNKEYGAYDLRKSYNATTSISILGGIAICAIILMVFSLSDGKAIVEDEKPIVILQMTDMIKPDPVKPEIKLPEKIAENLKNVAPVVSTDTSLNLKTSLINDELIQITRDRSVNDTLIFTDNHEELIPEETKIYVNVKEMPEFPGGITALMKYISDNLIYPEEAIRNNVQGRVVLKFVVEPDGTVGRTEIISGIDQALNDEAVRVVKSLPTFKPGKNDGVPVPVWFIIPVLFKLESI
jgi:protein TonB